jgi:hypothetical protein
MWVIESASPRLRLLRDPERNDLRRFAMWAFLEQREARLNTLASNFSVGQTATKRLGKIT